MKRKILSLMTSIAVVVYGSALPVRAADPLLLNATEVTLYFLYSTLEGKISIPVELPTSAQIKVMNPIVGETVRFYAEPMYLNVSTDGVVTPAPEYYKGGVGSYTKPETYDYIAYIAGSFDVTVYSGSRQATVTVNVENYAAKYVEDELDRVANDIMANNVSNYDKLDAICRYVASFPYGQGTTPASFILNGHGDCWASTNTIIALANRCGMRARPRQEDKNIVGGHYNAIVEVDGIPCIAEAGYGGDFRGYDITKRPLGYDFKAITYSIPDATATVEIVEYLGFDTDVTVPAVFHTDGTIKLSKVASISTGAFNDNDYIEKVTISEGIETLGAYCFFYCSKLKELNIPASLTKIEELQFWGANAVTTINVAENNPVYKSIDSVVYSRDETSLVLCPAAREGVFRVPDSVLTVGNGAFYNCKKLTKIIFGKNIKNINYMTCYNAESLKEIIIREGTQSIDMGAFTYCYYAQIEIPKSVTQIADNVFERNIQVSIIGYPGSYAEQYAKAKGIKFLDITSNSISKWQCGVSITNYNYDSTTKKISADVSVSNNSDFTGEADVTIAVYDNAGKLVALKTQYVELDKKQTKPISFSETVSNLTAKYTIKAFVWSTYNDMEPLTNPAVVNVE